MKSLQAGTCTTLTCEMQTPPCGYAVFRRFTKFYFLLHWSTALKSRVVKSLTLHNTVLYKSLSPQLLFWSHKLTAITEFSFMYHFCIDKQIQTLREYPSERCLERIEIQPVEHLKSARRWDKIIKPQKGLLSGGIRLLSYFDFPFSLNSFYTCCVMERRCCKIFPFSEIRSNRRNWSHQLIFVEPSVLFPDNFRGQTNVWRRKQQA